MMEPVVIVQGGSGTIAEYRWAGHLAGVKAAACVGYKVLKDGGSAVDAAEASVAYLEDCPVFNAGKGSHLTCDEQVEMDAIIMDGTTLNVGAVGAIRNVKNPVKVARLVMEKTPHILLVGEGANKFASAQGIEEIDPKELVTEHAKERLYKYRKDAIQVNKTNSSVEEAEHGTVGCAVVDKSGHTACATSTGGIVGQMTGRVGDTPFVGAGGYADDKIGAVSTTGQGEAIMKAALARHITSTMSTGQTVLASVQDGLSYMESRFAGVGGVVAVSCKGEAVAHSSAPLMSWAYVQEGKLHFGISQGQHEVEDAPI